MDNIEYDPFALKSVKIGDEIVYARPVSWAGEMFYRDGTDKDGNPIMPTSYESSCPGCSQRIEFDARYSSVKCEICGLGEYALDVNRDTPFNVDLDIDVLIGDELPEQQQDVAIPTPIDLENIGDMQEDTVDIVKAKPKRVRKPKPKAEVDYSKDYDNKGDKQDTLDIEDLIK